MRSMNSSTASYCGKPLQGRVATTNSPTNSSATPSCGRCRARCRHADTADSPRRFSTYFRTAKTSLLAHSPSISKRPGSRTKRHASTRAQRRLHTSNLRGKMRSHSPNTRCGSSGGRGSASSCTPQSSPRPRSAGMALAGTRPSRRCSNSRTPSTTTRFEPLRSIDRVSSACRRVILSDNGKPRTGWNRSRSDSVTTHCYAIRCAVAREPRSLSAGLLWR